MARVSNKAVKAANDSLNARALRRAKRKNAASDKAKRAVGVATPGKGGKGKPKSEAHKAAISAAMKKHHALRKRGKVKAGDATKVKVVKKASTAVKRAAHDGVRRAKAWAKRKDASAKLKIIQLEHKANPTKASKKKLLAAHTKFKSAVTGHKMVKKEHMSSNAAAKKKSLTARAIKAGKKLLGKTIDLTPKAKKTSTTPAARVKTHNKVSAAKSEVRKAASALSAAKKAANGRKGNRAFNRALEAHTKAVATHKRLQKKYNTSQVTK